MIRTSLFALVLTFTYSSIAAQSSPEATIAALRNQVFELSAAELALNENDTGPVWGVIMETGLDGGMYTLLTFADGSTSIYFGNGGGIIGAGDHSPVREASRKLLALANTSIGKLEPISKPVLPKPGEVRIYFHTYNGLRVGSGIQEVLRAGKHELSAIFYSAHDLITAVRENTAKR